jgi:hypothetical protein
VGLTWIVERTLRVDRAVPSHEQGLRVPCADF